MVQTLIKYNFRGVSSKKDLTKEQYGNNIITILLLEAK